MGVVFVILGIVVVIPTFGPFGILWTAIAGIIAVTNISYALGKKIGGRDLYSHEVVIEDEGARTGESVEAQLSKLSDLYEKRVISKEEYEKARLEILKDI